MPWPCALGNPLCQTSVSPAVKCSSRNTCGTIHPGERPAQSCQLFSLLAPACHTTSCWSWQRYSVLFPGCPRVENHKFTFLYRERAEEAGPWCRGMSARTGCELGRSAPKPRAGKGARGVAQRCPASPGGLWQWRFKGRSQGLKPSPRGAGRQSVRALSSGPGCVEGTQV